jgi:hypothetical protein
MGAIPDRIWQNDVIQRVLRLFVCLQVVLRSKGARSNEPQRTPRAQSQKWNFDSAPSAISAFSS